MESVLRTSSERGLPRSPALTCPYLSCCAGLCSCSQAHQVGQACSGGGQAPPGKQQKGAHTGKAKQTDGEICNVAGACAWMCAHSPVLLLQGQAFADAQASPEPTLCNAFLEVQSKTVDHLVDAASKLRAVLEGVLVSCLYSDRCRGCAGCIASDLFETAFCRDGWRRSPMKTRGP